MTNYDVFVYGSLMDKNEMTDVFGSDVEYVKTRLNGYVRDFSKASYTWGGEDKKAGVLGILSCQDEWCNGILVKNVNRGNLNNFYLRETGMSIEKYKHYKSGYIIGKIDNNKLDSKNKDSRNAITSFINSRLSKPNTDEEYKQLCYEAARSHGEDFYEEFCESTYEYYDLD